MAVFKPVKQKKGVYPNKKPTGISDNNNETSPSSKVNTTSFMALFKKASPGK